MNSSGNVQGQKEQVTLADLVSELLLLNTTNTLNSYRCTTNQGNIHTTKDGMLTMLL